MAWRVVFTDSGFWKYSRAHLVMSMTESCRFWCSDVWGPEEHGHPTKVFVLVPLHRDFSSFSESFDDVMHLDDTICKAIAIWHWGTLFLKYSTIFLHTLSQIGKPLPIFTSERDCLSSTSLISNHVTDLMSINLTFYSPLLPPSQLFWDL